MKKQTKDIQDPVGEDDIVDDTHGIVGDKGVSGAPSRRVVVSFGASFVEDGAQVESDGPKVVKGSDDGNDDDSDTVVQPPAPPPPPAPEPKCLKKMMAGIKRKYTLEVKKHQLTTKKCNQLLKTIELRDGLISKLESRLTQKETLIGSLKNKLTRNQESKQAIRDAIVAERTAKESRQEAKIAALRDTVAQTQKEARRLVKTVDSFDKELDLKNNRLNLRDNEITKLKEDVSHFKNEARSAKREVASLSRAVAKLKTDKSANMLERERISLAKKKYEAEIASTNQQKIVLEEKAKADRQLSVAAFNAKLKEEAAKKKKQDKRKEAYEKQQENAKRLKASMMVNLGDGVQYRNTHTDDGSIASFHHQLNRNNPSNGQFMNNRQLQQVSTNRCCSLIRNSILILVLECQCWNESWRL